MKCLNLGCGARYHRGWVNMDVAPQAPHILQWNVRRPLPLESGTFDVVYHSHLLEHLTVPDGAAVLLECHRVLRPGGIVRVVVPDLEQICRVYLEKLAAVTSGNIAAEADYDWMMLELLDQMARQRSGGDMGRFLANPSMTNREFVTGRIGAEATPRPGSGTPRSRRAQIKERFRSAVRKVGAGLLPPDALHAVDVGRFRLGGEVHQWMYDRFSLQRALRRAGFVEPMVRAAGDSAIPEWRSFELDGSIDGTAHKPDSLFMEALRRD